MELEWDPAKNETNERKHGISFLDAFDEFDDPHHFIENVTRLEYGEIRFKATGKLGERYFTVIFTDRIGVRRIISVRRSRTNERRQYDQGKENR